MKQTLQIPSSLLGDLWKYQNRGGRFRMHSHEELEVNLVIRGHATYLLCEKRFTMTRNTQLWLFPNQEHVLIHQSPDFEMWIGVWRPSLIRRACRDGAPAILRSPDPGHAIGKQIRAPDALALQNLFAQILQTRTDKSHFNAGLPFALLTAWQAQTHAGPLVGENVHPAVEQAAMLLQQSPETLSLTQLAEKVVLHPARLSHLFKKQTGISLVQFRQRHQLERFLALFRNRRHQNIMQTALAAGFGSYPQFHRVFKHHLRQSPAEWQKTL